MLYVVLFMSSFFFLMITGVEVLVGQSYTLQLPQLTVLITIILLASTEIQGSHWWAVVQAGDTVLDSASKQTASWCLKGPHSTEHRNYSFSFLLTGHSFRCSSVTVALMKKYGSSLCPCPPHPLPLSDNLPRPCQDPLLLWAPHPSLPPSHHFSTNTMWVIKHQTQASERFDKCFVL